MTTQDYVDGKIQTLKSEFPEILYDITHECWSPHPSFLDEYCRALFRDIVEKYRDLEVTNEYFLTAQVFIALNHKSKRCLGFTDGAGFTDREIFSTHDLDWELSRLLKEYPHIKDPIDFTLFICGYKSGCNDLIPCLIGSRPDIVSIKSK
ncbi:hypothetical protein COU57_01440 [Candidatus Pacearchaeota archaeon CG10_big_fil_rev_8_21_14_0_10_32_14]|nr:MAG: hypothetical protein COU57_01440 [Candidatus Pacearchaeota archaeon CG10_big_fil_rev_8_21_14_0_10_32_14]